MPNCKISFCPEGEGIPFMLYCQKSKKYLNSKKELVSREEAALDNINNFHQKDYKLSEIEVLTFEEYTKNPNPNI